MPSYDQPSAFHTVISRAPWWVPWLALLIIFGGFAIYQFSDVAQVAKTNQEARVLIREAQIDSCNRVNVLREETNKRAGILQNLFTITAQQTLENGNPEMANDLLEAAGQFGQVELTNCEEAYPSDIEKSGFGG